VKYDIWTLGCLLLDFLTWYLRGWEAVDTLFTDARLMDEGWVPGPFNPGSTPDDKWLLYEDKFYKQSNDGRNVRARLKPSVIEVRPPQSRSLLACMSRAWEPADNSSR
jgi:hypothetical protein